LKIAAVDDDNAFLTILEMMFRKFKDTPLQTCFFSDSVSALNEICTEQPDILFLDIFMPNMNGWEFLQQLEEKKVPVKVYMLSSSVDKNDQNRAKNYSIVQDFISKPLSYKMLKTVLNIN
jgi:two-component system, response regulator PdtaR